MTGTSLSCSLFSLPSAEKVTIISSDTSLGRRKDMVVCLSQASCQETPHFRFKVVLVMSTWTGGPIDKREVFVHDV